jgi:hypothetical protein
MGSLGFVGDAGLFAVFGVGILVKFGFCVVGLLGCDCGLLYGVKGLWN